MKWVKQTGFTIVELLIVIVVIAILAAITIVAYNGIQNRAYDSAIQSDLSTLAKKIQMRALDNNDSYPSNDTQLEAIDFTASQANYYTASNNEGNLTVCVIPSGTTARFSIAAKSKSGTVFVYNSGQGFAAYPTGSTYNGAHGTVCPALGYSGYASSQGYHGSSWGTPGWKAWTQ